MAASSHELSLRDLLRNAAAEVAWLSSLIGPVEDLLERGFAHTTGKDRAVLQNLDLLLQTSDNLATFLDSVSKKSTAQYADRCADGAG